MPSVSAWPTRREPGDARVPSAIAPRRVEALVRMPNCAAVYPAREILVLFPRRRPRFLCRCAQQLGIASRADAHRSVAPATRNAVMPIGFMPASRHRSLITTPPRRRLGNCSHARRDHAPGIVVLICTRLVGDRLGALSCSAVISLSVSCRGPCRQPSSG